MSDAVERRVHYRSTITAIKLEVLGMLALVGFALFSLIAPPRARSGDGGTAVAVRTP